MLIYDLKLTKLGQQPKTNFHSKEAAYNLTSGIQAVKEVYMIRSHHRNKKIQQARKAYLLQNPPIQQKCSPMTITEMNPKTQKTKPS